MNRNLIIAIVMCILFLTNNSYSTDYFVSPSATGTGNGSLTNPYTLSQAFANAQAGDVVGILPGNYTATALTTGHPGTVNNRIVFTGTDPNNKPIITNSGGASAFIRIYHDYITLKDLHLINNDDKFTIESWEDGGKRGLILDGLDSYWNYDSGSRSEDHIRLNNFVDGIIRNCTLVGSGSNLINIQVAPQGLGRCSNWIIENNEISTSPYHHAINIFPSTGWNNPAFIDSFIIRNNYIHDITDGQSAIYARYIRAFKIYNNIFVNPSGNALVISPLTASPVILHDGLDGSFDNNTIIMNSGTGVLNFSANNINVRNNIFYGAGSGFSYMQFRQYGSSGTGDPINSQVINNNLYYSVTGNNSWDWAGNSYSTISAWRSGSSQDAQGLQGNPLFTNVTSDWTLQSTSPSINAGATLSYFSTDFNGSVRTGTWDIGAYEFGSSGGGDIVPPELLNASLTSSTSLVLNFSEVLNTNSAQNSSNYSITNGINVSSAVLAGTQVMLTTSTHISGSYAVTVNNVTDLAGNVVDPQHNSAAYEYTLIDTVRPQVVSAEIIDSITLKVFFSEVLDAGTSQNSNNYAINGVGISNASLVANIVTLTTTIHTPGSYSVIVSNISDLSGNIIDTLHNSAIYEYQPELNSGFLMFPVINVLESVTPEPMHYGEKTIDGKGFYQNDPDSRWAGDTMPEWLVYDLGDVQILNSTKLSFYKWNEGRTYNYSVQVSTDSVVWTTVRSDVVSSLNQEWSQEDIGPIDARYIKIIFVSSNQNSWAGLWEAEFWGYLKLPTNLDGDEFTAVSYILEQNYPNPFNPTTKIKVRLPQSTQMRLAIYNVVGELIVEIVNGEFASGNHEFTFDATGLASGMYLYRVESPEFTETKKMVLLR